MKALLATMQIFSFFGVVTAAAQPRIDPVTATRPAPTVTVLLDATSSHPLASDSTSPPSCAGDNAAPCALLQAGETELQLARRVLTGGWGFSGGGATPLAGDWNALIRTDGVMDQYKVRWGVAWYDGLGTRVAIDPTRDDDLAQRTVIDFRQAPNDDFLATPMQSWLPLTRTEGDGFASADGRLAGAFDALTGAPFAAGDACREDVVVAVQTGVPAPASFAGESALGAARRLYEARRVYGGGVGDASNRVFAIHFGATDNWVGGNDGTPTGPVGARRPVDGDPLEVMRAAFSSIFSLVLSGTFTGTPPFATSSGAFVGAWFSARGCAGNDISKCNLLRPGSLTFRMPAAAQNSVETSWDAGEILRSREHLDRNVFTTPPAGEVGAASDTSCASSTHCPDLPHLVSVDDTFGPLGAFVRGDPEATFAHGIRRGDTDGDGVVDSPDKLGDIANSRPVIVGAPSGIGEGARWQAFLRASMPRETPWLTRTGERGVRVYGGPTQVRSRDQVMYVGGNDGLVHAFLTARAVPSHGGERYAALGVACPVDASAAQYSHGACDGAELWAYAPRLLQSRWGAMTSGPVSMMGNTAATGNVLFTKGRATPGQLCTMGLGCPGWEYRTVLVQCLGDGAPGCLAMDVTNPFSPRLLWERSFAARLPGIRRVGATPQLVRLKTVVGTTTVPYAGAALGLGASSGIGAERGAFIVVGIEDGVVHVPQGSAGDQVPTSLDSTPTCFDHDDDGFTDTCYVLGGSAQVYKVRFDGGRLDAMTISLLFDGRIASGRADLRSPGSLVAAQTPARRVNLFFVSGDESAVERSGAQNVAFNLFDDSMRATRRRIDVAHKLRPRTACPTITALPSGEKVIFDPLIIGGTVFFTTWLPAANACAGGVARLHGVRLGSCAPALDTNGDGIADSASIPLGNRVPTAPSVDPRDGRVRVGFLDGPLADVAVWAARR